MAGAYICRSSHRNPPPGDKDELVRGPSGAPTKDRNTLTFSSPVSWALTLAPTPAPTFALPSTNELFKQFMKAYLESN